MSGLATQSAQPRAVWPLAGDDLILLVDRAPDGAGARIALADAGELETVAIGRVADDAGAVALSLARLGWRGAAARPLAGSTLADALAEIAGADPRPGLVVVEADTGVLATCLAALVAEPAPAAIAVVRAPGDAAGRWDAPLFDAGYVRLRPGACALIGEAADPYVRSALLTDLGLLREPSANAVSMDTLGNNGRFGNQLFQYAFLALYGLRNNCGVQTPRWIGQMLYGLTAEPPNPSFSRQGFPLFTGVERHLWTMKEPPVNVDFWGYFQEIPVSWRRHRQLLRRLFTPRPMFVELIERWLKRTVPPDATLVGIHVRRGDYPYFDHDIMPWFRPIPVEWYQALVGELWPTLERPLLFVASDDAAGVAPHFAAYDPVIAPAYELALPELGFLPDFCCMQRCAVLATVNSSFSRMAALLADDGQIAYLPSMKTERFEPYEPWLDEDFWARFEA
jgi:hypothetical protein